MTATTVAEVKSINLGAAVRLALAAIAPSKTNPRKHFDEAAMAELTANVAKNGVLQPILVRPLPPAREAEYAKAAVKAEARPTHELVAGERRYRAAVGAKLPVIDAIVRELTDPEVLEFQVVENLHRADLHPLEEAEGYEALEKCRGPAGRAYTIADIAQKVGKSVSYVYQRMNLCKLSPEARKAFYDGKLSLSTAVITSRILAKLQMQFVKEITQDPYGEGPMGAREAQEHAQQSYMLRLTEAPFSTTDAKLVEKAGACTNCPKRTGNQPELFPDVKSKDVCTDPKCFDDKRQAHFAVARGALEAKGKKVVAGDDAKKAMPHWQNGNDHLAGGYVKLNDTTYVQGRGHVKVGDLVGKEYEPVLIQHPGTGKVIEVVTPQAIAKASGKKTPKSSGNSGSSYNYEAAGARAKAKGPDVDEMLTARLAQLIHKNAPKQFGKAWLLDLTREFYERLNLRDDEAVAKAWGWPESAFSRGYRSKLPAQVEKLGERDLVLFMFHLIFAVGPYTRDGVLKLFEIKEPAVRELIIEERKQAAKAAREEAKAKAEAKKAAKPVATANQLAARTAKIVKAREKKAGKKAGKKKAAKK